MRVSRGCNPCLTQCEVHIKPTHTWQWDRVNGGEWWLNICHHNFPNDPIKIQHLLGKFMAADSNCCCCYSSTGGAAQEALDMTQRSPSGNWPASPPTSKCFSSMTRSQDRLSALGPWDKNGMSIELKIPHAMPHLWHLWPWHIYFGRI